MKRREYGTGKISYEKKTKRFRARLEFEGQTIPCGTHPTWEAADVALFAMRKRLTEERAVIGGTTLNEFGQSWIKRRESEGKDDDQSRWDSHIKEDLIGSKPVDAIHPADVNSWVDRLMRRRAKKGNLHASQSTRKLSRSTCQNALNMLRVCLERAKEIGVIKTNPAQGVTLPGRREDLLDATKDNWTWLSIDEQTELLEGISTEEKFIVQFAIWTGLRKMELFALRAIDVHRDSPSPFIVVRYGSADGPTKTRKIRRIPMLPGAIDAWDCWTATMQRRIDATGIAFPSHMSNAPRGATPRCFEATVKRLGIAGQTGIKVTWHSLRHTCASMLVSGSWGDAWSLEEIKGMLGHKSISTTERYAHLAGTALTRAADRLRASMLKPSAPVVDLRKHVTK